MADQRWAVPRVHHIALDGDTVPCDIVFADVENPEPQHVTLYRRGERLELESATVSYRKLENDEAAGLGYTPEPGVEIYDVVIRDLGTA